MFIVFAALLSAYHGSRAIDSADCRLLLGTVSIDGWRLHSTGCDSGSGVEIFTFKSKHKSEVKTLNESAGC